MHDVLYKKYFDQRLEGLSYMPAARVVRLIDIDATLLTVLTTGILQQGHRFALYRRAWKPEDEPFAVFCARPSLLLRTIPPPHSVTIATETTT